MHILLCFLNQSAAGVIQAFGQITPYQPPACPPAPLRTGSDRFQSKLVCQLTLAPLCCVPGSSPLDQMHRLLFLTDAGAATHQLTRSRTSRDRKSGTGTLEHPVTLMIKKQTYIRRGARHRSDVTFALFYFGGLWHQRNVENR